MRLIRRSRLMRRERERCKRTEWLLRRPNYKENNRLVVVKSEEEVLVQVVLGNYFLRMRMIPLPSH